MPAEQRAVEYPKVRQRLLQQGIIKPEDSPDQYDEGYFRQTWSAYTQSPGYLDRQKTQAEIAKLRAEAARKGSATEDPLARQMALYNWKDQKDQEKKDREMRQYSNIGDWKLSEGASPTADDAKKFKGGVSAARSLLANLNEYQNLISNKGSEYAGKNAQRMESLARDIQLAAKNEDLYGLGVLTGPDLTLLEEIIRAPTGLIDQFNPMAGSKAVNKAQQFREMINTKLGAKAKTYGFEPSESWNRLAAGGTPMREESPKSGSAYADQAPTIKHGTVEDGYVFMGGDPADKKNWKRK
jgi:hypothetical protein